VIVLRPDLVPGTVARENVYFLRRHPDGQLCNGHLHESLDDARECIDLTKLGGLWHDLARIMVDVQVQVNPGYGEYPKNVGTLTGGEWLKSRGR